VGLLSRFSNNGRAAAFGRGAARAMLFSAGSAIQKAGGMDQISPGEICLQVLKTRLHWNVRDDGVVEFRGATVSDRVAVEYPAVVTNIQADTTVGNLTVTVIIVEYSYLFTEAEGRRSLIQFAVDGCAQYFKKKGFYDYEA